MKRSRTVAVAAAGAAAIVAGTPAAAVAQQEYSGNQDNQADRGVSSNLTTPSTWNCGTTGPSAFLFNDVWMLVGDHGDGSVNEWVELGLEYCTFAPSRNFVWARCMRAPGSGTCSYSESTLSATPPAPGGVVTIKHINTSNSPGNWNTWTSYLGTTVVATVRDNTPSGAFFGNSAHAGLEVLGQNGSGGSLGNGVHGDMQYRDNGGAWHDWYGDFCWADHPAEGSWYFGSHQDFIYNYRGGAGIC